MDWGRLVLERLAMILGRHVRVRGVDRALRLLYPIQWDARRVVRGIRARADGLLVDVDTRQHVDWYMLFRGDYEPQMRGLFQVLTHAGSVAVDVGANVGAHTLTLSRLVGPSGRVLAFEPNPIVRTRLARNLAINSIRNVVVHACALGSADCRMPLMVPAVDSAEAANPGMSSLVALDTPHDLVEVEVTSLDAVVNASGLRRLDLVKIDVQGYEMSVLEGMRAQIERFAPAIIFEYEDWAWGKAGRDFQDACDLFSQHAYSLWQIGRGLELSSISQCCPPSRHAEILALAANDSRLRSMNVLSRRAMNG